MASVSSVRKSHFAHLPGPLNYKSVMDIVKADQVMVYGWTHCKYLQVFGSLEESPDPKNPSPFKRVFNCAFGDTKFTTLEGRKIEELHIDLPGDDEHFFKELNRRCKSGVTDLVLENLKREEEGLPIIPLLFCIDIDDTGPQPWDKARNPWDAKGANPWITTPDTLCEKDRMSVTGQMNNFTTHAELRRCWKLVSEFGDPRIRAVAERTFRFVKVVQDKETKEYSLVQVKAPWDHSDWKKCWEKRMKISATQVKDSKAFPWRIELMKAIRRYYGSKRKAALQLAIASSASPSSGSAVQTTSVIPQPKEPRSQEAKSELSHDQ